MFPALVPPPSWAGEFFGSYMVKLGLQIIVCVCVCACMCAHACREHVPGITNLLSSLGRLRASCHPCFIVLGVCLMLLLHGSVVKQACFLE